MYIFSGALYDNCFTDMAFLKERFAESIYTSCCNIAIIMFLQTSYIRVSMLLLCFFNAFVLRLPQNVTEKLHQILWSIVKYFGKKIDADLLFMVGVGKWSFFEISLSSNIFKTNLITPWMFHKDLRVSFSVKVFLKWENGVNLNFIQ